MLPNRSAITRHLRLRSPRVVLDYDGQGNLVGIDIDNASTKVEIHKLIVSRLPASVETIAG